LALEESERDEENESQNRREYQFNRHDELD
jgi:hypothetical protein